MKTGIIGCGVAMHHHIPKILSSALIPMPMSNSLNKLQISGSNFSISDDKRFHK